jgi:tRNA pseudouridine38-40 synthase
VICQAVRDPLRETMAWRVWPALEEDLLVDAAKCLPGRRDFAAFGSAPRKGGETVRTVSTSEWSHAGDEWHYEIVADGFLYRMVRRLVYAQVAVAEGRCPQGALTESLESGERSPGLPAGVAPAQGLTLVNVNY